MKPNLKSQTMLKVALLAVLAANVSFQPFKEAIRQTDLSAVTTSEVGTSQPSAPAATNAVPEQKSAATKLGSEVGERDYMEACGGAKKHRVIFRQHTYAAVAGKPEKTITVAFAQNVEVSDSEHTIGGALQREGEYSQAAREALMKDLRKLVNAAYDCSGTPNSPTKAERDEEAKLARAELEKEQKEQDAKVRRCELKKTRVAGGKFEYEAIEGDKEMIRCQIKRLTLLENEKDDKGKTLSKSKQLAEVQKIVNEHLRRPIKKMLLSKDESENEDGIELADEVIEALNDIGRGEHRIEKLANMFQGYKAGGETARRSRERSEDVSEVRERLTSARNELRQNPRDMYAIQDLRMALEEHRNLANQIDYDIYYGPVAAMQMHRSQGHLNTGDYNEFLSPFSSIKRSMEDMLRQSRTAGVSPGGVRFSDMNAPQDLWNTRTSMDRGFVRQHGASAYPLSMPNVRSQFKYDVNSVPSVFGATGRNPYPF
ncbi:MAG: hypothetical protein NDI61_07640 [Bdellovibrionaceae bacterium]|nr:hypothetical protein [Pseudobdellovibrionaceae bacterium]